jgi:type IV secretion system protein VirB1
MISPFLIAALLETCAPRMDTRTVAAIVERESYGNSWAVYDDTSRRSYAPASYQGALDLAHALLAKRHNLDLGLGQVNSVHLSQPGVSVETMLRPCPNLREAQTVYNAAFAASNDERRALIAYNGSGATSLAYADAVIAAKTSPFVDAVLSSRSVAVQPAPIATSRPRVPALFFSDGKP